MKIFYGDVELKLATVEINRTPIWANDESGSYLYTQFDINCVCMANSQVPDNYSKLAAADGVAAIGAVIAGAEPPKVRGPGISWVRSSPGNEVPSENSAPVKTDNAIRLRLVAPRRKLRVLVDKEVVLESPVGNAQCDAKNGPLPKAFPITESFGNAESLMYNWQCTTWVNECGVNASDQPEPALLSNRFTQTQVLDEDYFITNHTEGVAHFRVDKLLERDVRPDDIRTLLFHPIPYGFKRENIKVWHQGSMDTMYYSFTDIQQPMQCVIGADSNATRIRMRYEQAIISETDLLSGLVGLGREVQDIQWRQRLLDQHNKPREADRSKIVSNAGKPQKTPSGKFKTTFGLKKTRIV